jgi:hypothetical protein
VTQIHTDRHTCLPAGRDEHRLFSGKKIIMQFEKLSQIKKFCTLVIRRICGRHAAYNSLKGKA